MPLFKRYGKQVTKFGNHWYGGCGGSILLRRLTTITPEDHPAVHQYVANTSADWLEKYFGDETNEHLVHWDEARQLTTLQPLGMDVTGGVGAGADPEVGLRAAQSSRDALRQGIERNNVNVFLAGAGKGTGGPTLQVAAGICQEINAELPPQEQKINLGILIMPHGGEGLTANADLARDEIIKLIPTFTVYNSMVDDYLETLSQKERDAFTTDDLNRVVDEKVVMRILDTCYEVMLRPGERHVDQADMRNFLKKGNLVYQGTMPLPKEADKLLQVTADEVVGELFPEHGHFQDINIAKNGEEVILWFLGWDPVYKKKEIMEKTRAFVTQGDPNKPLKIHHGIRTKLTESETPRVIAWVIAKDTRPVERASKNILPARPEQVPMVEIPIAAVPKASESAPSNGTLLQLAVEIRGQERTIKVPSSTVRRYNHIRRQGVRASREEWLSIQREILEETTKQGAPATIDTPLADWGADSVSRAAPPPTH